jgi:hypothetical protein
LNSDAEIIESGEPLKTIIARHRQDLKTGSRYARLPRDAPPQPARRFAVAGAALAVATLC